MPLLNGTCNGLPKLSQFINRRTFFRILITGELIFIVMPAMFFTLVWLLIGVVASTRKVEGVPEIILFPISIFILGVGLCALFMLSARYNKYARSGIPKLIYVSLIFGGIFSVILVVMFASFFGVIIFVVSLYFVFGTIMFEISHIRSEENLD